jgi:hypothetical protein
MTVQEFKEKWMDDGEIIADLDEVYSDEYVDGKWVLYKTVYKVDEQFFSVETSQSNTGYWGDSDYGDTNVSEVFPYEFSEIRYK